MEKMNLTLDLTELTTADLGGLSYLITGDEGFLKGTGIEAQPVAIFPLERSFPEFAELLLNVIIDEIYRNRQHGQRSERTLIIDQVDNTGQGGPLPGGKLALIKNWSRAGHDWASNYEELQGTKELLKSIENQV